MAGWQQEVDRLLTACGDRPTTIDDDSRRLFVEAVLKREAQEADALLRAQHTLLGRRDPFAALSLLRQLGDELTKEEERMEEQEERACLACRGSRRRGAR